MNRDGAIIACLIDRVDELKATLVRIQDDEQMTLQEIRALAHSAIIGRREVER